MSYHCIRMHIHTLARTHLHTQSVCNVPFLGCGIRLETLVRCLVSVELKEF
jgi:hypothetical protein